MEKQMTPDGVIKWIWVDKRWGGSIYNIRCNLYTTRTRSWYSNSNCYRWWWSICKWQYKFRGCREDK